MVRRGRETHLSVAARILMSAFDEGHDPHRCGSGAHETADSIGSVVTGLTLAS